VALAGATDTDATGIGAGALTLKLEELVLPSLVALIIALPDPIALTVPAVSTVATLMLELAQLTVRPVIRFPLESSRIAVARAAWPTRTAEGFTATSTVAMGVGGGGITAIDA